ncbi:MAG: hypothetical protein Fur0032_06870 [Terrimicrobiaceae bacterium]
MMLDKDFSNPMPTTDLSCRHDVASLAASLALAARRDLSPGQARVRTDHTGAFYGQTGIELEGWSRPLWALAPLIAGGGRFAKQAIWRPASPMAPIPGTRNTGAARATATRVLSKWRRSRLPFA